MSKTELQKSVAKARREKLENRFMFLWRCVSGCVALERQVQFLPDRKFRADFAHLPSRTLIEIDGGIFGRGGGGHNRGAGYAADRERDLVAWLAGWTVIRLTEKQLTGSNLESIAKRLSSLTP